MKKIILFASLLLINYACKPLPEVKPRPSCGYGFEIVADTCYCSPSKFRIKNECRTPDGKFYYGTVPVNGFKYLDTMGFYIGQQDPRYAYEFVLITTRDDYTSTANYVVSSKGDSMSTAMGDYFFIDGGRKAYPKFYGKFTPDKREINMKIEWYVTDVSPWLLYATAHTTLRNYK